MRFSSSTPRPPKPRTRIIGSAWRVGGLHCGACIGRILRALAVPSPRTLQENGSMLSKADNEYLCRIGPGTPMGRLMREYWMPAIRADELPGPDCPPLRVRLLGEDLIAFRVSTGQVGLV